VRGVRVGSGQHLGDLPPRIHRDERVAQFVVRSVQRYREGDLEALIGEAADRGHEAHRRYGDRALRQS
jgi:hypothetical protein